MRAVGVELIVIVGLRPVSKRLSRHTKFISALVVGMSYGSYHSTIRTHVILLLVVWWVGLSGEEDEQCSGRV